MEVKFSLYLVLLFAISISAQKLPEHSQSPVEIFPSKCAQTTDNIFGSNSDQAIRNQAQLREQLQDEIRESPRNIPTAAANVYEENSFVKYNCEFKFKNTGDKEIRKITWKRVVYDKNTNEIIGANYYTGEVKIAPGKVKKLINTSVQRSKDQLKTKINGKKVKPEALEKIVLIRIDFSNGSQWTPRK